MKKILLIEPDSVIALLSEKYLLNHHYEVEHCTDGKTALDLLGSESFDLVLSEIDLDGLSGLDVLKLMKRQYADIPFIFYSVNDSNTNRIEAECGGAAGFISKKHEFINLPQLIDQIIHQDDSDPSNL